MPPAAAGSRRWSRFETGEITTNTELPATPVVLDVSGRAITALGTDGTRIWFDFGDLCEKPTSAQDYLVIAGRLTSRAPPAGWS